MPYTPPPQHPYQDSPSTATPVFADALNDIVESLVDLDGSGGRVAALEAAGPGTDQSGRAAALALILGV